MKRIALVSTGLNDLGGANNHLKNVYNGLVSLGYKVNIILCSSKEKELKDHLTGNEVEPSDIIFINRYDKLLLLPIIFKLKKIFKTGKYDVIHSFHIQSDIFSAIAAKMAGISSLYSYYESTIFPENISVLKKMFYKFANLFIKDKFIKTVVVSNGLKNELIRNNFRKPATIVVIYLGIGLPEKYFDIELDLSNLNNRRPLIGTIARLSREKGIERFINAIPYVLHKVPEARFIVIGSGAEEIDLKALASDLRVGNKISFNPWADDVYKALGSIDVFVMPSIREGCPTALIEALSMKRPVVASNIEGINEVIDNGVDGLLVDTENVEFFSDAIIELCYNPKRAKTLGKNGYEKVRKQFTLKKEIDNIKTLYAS